MLAVTKHCFVEGRYTEGRRSREAYNWGFTRCTTCQKQSTQLLLLQPVQENLVSLRRNQMNNYLCSA